MARGRRPRGGLPRARRGRGSPPPDLIDGILAQVGRERQLRKRRQRRRRVGRSILATAAAALFVAIGFFALPPLISPGPPLEQVTFSETAAGVEAHANLIAHTWGTETKLVASGLRDGQTYKVALVSGDGALVPSGAFIGTGESPMECNLNAPLLREDVAGLEVRSANGELMLYAELPEDAPSAGQESPLAVFVLGAVGPTPRRRASRNLRRSPPSAASPKKTPRRSSALPASGRGRLRGRPARRSR